MRIIFSIDHIYLHGGAEKVLAEKANYFADVLGYEVIILTSEQQNRLPCYPLSDKVRLIDIRVNYERNKSYFNKVNLAKIPFHFTQLKKTLKQLNPDVLIVVNFGFDFYWMPFFYKRIPKIKEFHSSRYFEYQHRKENQSVLQKIKYRFNDWIESKYDKLILLNPDETAYYKSKNAVVIPNPISIGGGKALLVNKQVIAAGRIAPVKGFEKLIKAWSIVSEKQPDWQLHIYGEDYLGTQAQLRQLIIDKGLEHHVFFKGTSSNLPETMIDYSLYLMTSQTECFPMVLLESLSVGLPIVSFDCPTGPRNIISANEDGFLIGNQDITAFADKIVYLIENEDERFRIGNNAKKNAARFSINAIMEQWEHLILNLK